MKGQYTRRLTAILVAIVCFASATSILLLYSAAGGHVEPWLTKQLYTMIGTLPICLVLFTIDLKTIHRWSYFYYVMTIILLILADVIGHKAMGAQRWLKIGYISIQPSEFAKIAIILVLSRYFASLNHNMIQRFGFLCTPIALVLIPTILILRQPNLGTAIIIISISVSIFFAAGVTIKRFPILIISALPVLPLVWHFMHAYQKRRILTFLYPESDPLGAGYNIMQSKIAIGSGGFLGKGLLQGTQSQLSFLPEKQTDFIFTLLAEEFGLLSVFCLICIYLTICLSCYYASINCKYEFGRLICVGVSVLFFTHVLINIGMIAGLLPAVGIPLPFLSYGRSNLVVSYMSIALVLNVAWARLRGD
ncbi:rod shape-determining protein RodA [Rickettsiales endosymbiont of Peranema trichophorum]|nr:rod shape-determining protein RodA [Rickettsiales endosymbiont of Peranema trichophorum]